MVLARISSAFRRQDWFTVGIEFVLLVGGILFALYLDNLNQQRKDQGLYKQYLEQLVEDLQMDVSEAKDVIERTYILDEMAEYLLDVIDAGTETGVEPGRLIRATLTSGYVNLPQSNRQTFEELINTGNLRLFKDTALKRLITGHYAATERGRQWDNLIRSVQVDYRRITRDLLTHEQFRWARGNAMRVENYETPPPALDFPQFLKRARANEELIGIISAMAEIQERVRQDSERMIFYSDNLIEEIENRL